MDLLYLSRHFRNMPAQGDLPLTEFVRAVLATGYSGYLSLEVFNDQFRGTPPRSIALDGKRSITMLVDAALRAEPLLAPARPLPPRVPVEAVSFVEFSSSPVEGAELVDQFRAMGFANTARHRSKNVELFTQGDIRLVLNTEDRGLTFSNFLTHGTSAYAIGLEVADAGAALDRAVALGAQMFDQQVPPGQLHIPAIRGVGGSLIYLLDRKSELATVWDTEFIRIKAPGTDAALEHIDHIAQTMKYNELLTWILYYTSIFDTVKSSMVDVSDPGGLVRSQVIENSSGSLRLTFNGTENDRTFAGRFVRETFGSGIQHIALASSDIFRTAKALASWRFEPLLVSPNYYADVQARFGLDDVQTELLRKHALLYDRDTSGEFYQLFGRAGSNGFFFEIVERKGYRGYGAANAPFRIAAQQRAAVRPAME
jgi:4-hydroxyphenylpyruvate dioxygenase